MEGLQHLSDKEYSYRYMRIGEEYDDVEEFSGVDENIDWSDEKLNALPLVLNQKIR